MENLNIQTAESIFDSIRGSGNDEIFSSAVVEKTRADYFKECEKNELKEKIRRTKAFEEAAGIYLTF
ncbi:MAG: hypothetical protein WCR31_11650 [Treponema sp.]